MKHGESAGGKRSKELRCWIAMRNRCLCPTSTPYPNYGGRGIKVCERWFWYENFLADMGRAPSPGHSLERIDNNKGYYPENCKWATRKEQLNNTRHNLVIKYKGVKKNLTQWCEELGLNYGTIYARIYRKMPARLAFTRSIAHKQNEIQA